MSHILTDSLLEDHLNCNTKSYLRLRGQSGQVTDYSALCSRLDAGSPLNRRYLPVISEAGFCKNT
jgi:hypothetical protein